MRTRIVGRFILIVGLCLTLAGCKEVLYSSLTERDANAMLAHLDAAGISASRQVDKDGNYTLLVDTLDLAAAITVLQNEGMPKTNYETIGSVFADEGIVGTPFEERVRFIYAMNEELSRTLASIHGVSGARVHIMIPEARRFEQTATNSRASVVIHYEDGFSAQQNVPTIKTMVSHAVENLEYDNVAVALFAAETLQVSAPLPPSESEIQVMKNVIVEFSSIKNAWIFAVGALALLLLLIVAVLRIAIRLALRRAQT